LPLWPDFQNVRLIFTNFLNFLTGVLGLNHQVAFEFLAGFGENGSAVCSAN